MNNNDERREQAGSILRRRRKLVYWSSLPFFMTAAAALLSRITAGRFPPIPFAVAGPAAMLIFLVTLAAHVLIWRCPVCEGYLGVVGSPKFCPKCGVRFDAGGAGRDGGT